MRCNKDIGNDELINSNCPKEARDKHVLFVLTLYEEVSFELMIWIIEINMFMTWFKGGEKSGEIDE